MGTPTTFHTVAEIEAARAIREERAREARRGTIRRFAGGTCLLVALWVVSTLAIAAF